MDLLLAILSWTVIWNLKMNKREKIGLSCAMSIGILFVLRLPG